VIKIEIAQGNLKIYIFFKGKGFVGRIENMKAGESKTLVKLHSNQIVRPL
jgi:ribosomal protein S9